jgi:CheY-like chemotaxis protein
MSELGRLLIVDDDRKFAAELVVDGKQLGLTVEAVHEGATFEATLKHWNPTIVAMDLVMPEADGLELLRLCARLICRASNPGGFELYLKMAEEMASNDKLNVVAKLPKPFRPKQFSYLLMSLI